MNLLNIFNEISDMDIKIYDSGEAQRVRLHWREMSLELYMNAEKTSANIKVDPNKKERKTHLKGHSNMMFLTSLR